MHGVALLALWSCTLIKHSEVHCTFEAVRTTIIADIGKSKKRSTKNHEMKAFLVQPLI
jgi:hypothetical protein